MSGPRTTDKWGNECLMQRQQKKGKNINGSRCASTNDADAVRRQTPADVTVLLAGCTTADTLIQRPKIMLSANYI